MIPRVLPMRIIVGLELEKRPHIVTIRLRPTPQRFIRKRNVHSRRVKQTLLDIHTFTHAPHRFIPHPREIRIPRGHQNPLSPIQLIRYPHKPNPLRINPSGALVMIHPRIPPPPE